MKLIKSMVRLLTVFIALSLLGCSSDDSSTSSTSTSTSTSDVAAVTLSAPATLMTADGTSTMTLTATVVDASGDAVSGENVIFTRDLGAISSTSDTNTNAYVVDVVTDSNGQATVVLTSEVVLDTATVTAAVSGFSASQSITFVAGVPASVTVSASSTSINPTGTSTVSATVIDTNGLPIENETVTFAVTTDNSGVPTTTLVSASTNSSGIASTTYTAGSTAGVSDTVTATASSAAVSNTVVISISTSAQSQDIASLSLNAPATTLTADGTSTMTLTATVLDSNGDAVSGVNVTFTRNLGAISAGTGFVDGNNNVYVVETTSDASGQATVDLTSDVVLGTATVTVSTSGLSASESIAFVVGSPATILASASPTTVNSIGSSTISAIVTDASGLPISNETVTFAVTTDNSGVPLTTLMSAITNSSGMASSIYTAGSTTGTIDTVTATTSSVAISDTVNISVSASAQSQDLAKLVLNAPATTLTADGTSQMTLTAKVEDASGAAISGVNVTFTRDLGAITAGSGFVDGNTNAYVVEVTTDANGLATVDLTSDVVLGTAIVTAAASGLSDSESITFVVGTPTAVLASAAPTTVNPAGTSTISATLTDTNGLPVGSETVTFAVTVDNSGVPVTTLVSAITNSSGVATATYTAGAVTGTDTVTATASSAVVSDTATIDVSATSQVVGSVNMTNGSTTLTADNSSTSLVRVSVLDTSATAATSQAVTMVTTLGSLLESDGATAYGSNAPYTTDSNGEVVFYLKSGTTLGTATVTATSSGFNTSSDIVFEAGAPTGVTVSSLPTTVSSGETSTITAVVSDGTNPVESETVRFEFTTNNSNATLSAITVTTDANGNASVTYTAGTSSGTDTIRATATSNGTTGTTAVNVDVGSGGTGTPEAALVTVSSSQIYVSGVGKNESTGISIAIVDGAGNKIDDSGYADENLKLTFSTSPNGGELMGGNDLSGTSVTPANPVWIGTSSGVATANLQSGSIAGVVEILIEVYDGNGQLASDKLFETTISQIVISSGSAHAINLTSPNLNSIEDLGGGVYKRIGKAAVTDRYGNAVPDGTVVNFGLIDTVLAASSDASTTAASKTLTDLTGMTHSDDDDAAADPSFWLDTVSVIRNGVNRFIELNDRILITNADAEDKSRIIEANSTGDAINSISNTTLDMAKAYNNSAASLNYVIGSATLGGQISGITFDSDGVEVEVTGVAETKDGIATFYVTYPANEQRIRIGCGIGGKACDAVNTNGVYPQNQTDCLAAGGGTGNWNQYQDKRFSPSDSAEVYVVASASESSTDSAVMIDQGQFCFSSISGYSLASVPGILSGDGVVTLHLRDGGDMVPLPFHNVSASGTVETRGSGCFSDAADAYQVGVDKAVCDDAITGLGLTWHGSDFSFDLTNGGCITDNPGAFTSGDGIGGSCSGFVDVTGTHIVPGDSGTVTWTAGDASVSVVVTIP